MDSFELNKIIGAVLGTLLFVMGVGFLAEAIYHPIQGRGPGYTLPEPVVAEAGGEAAPEAPAVPLAVLLASADAAAGQAAVRKCTSCHNFEKGAGNKQGPELWGVVGRPEGGHPDFAYSEALLAHNAAGDTWTYENLDHFLNSPKDYAPGTKMTFAGVKDPVERANILAYLQTLSATPVAFPAPPPEGAPAAGADAAPAVPTDADAIATPTESQSETPVQGTPTTSAPGSGETPATDAPTAPGTQQPAAPAPAAPAEAPAALAPATP